MLTGAGQAARIEAGQGDLVLPPDYNGATDDLWIAQPGYLFSDAAGATLLTGVGNALSWRSLRGTLGVVENGDLIWNGVDEIAFSNGGALVFPVSINTTDTATQMMVVRLPASLPDGRYFSGGIPNNLYSWYVRPGPDRSFAMPQALGFATPASGQYVFTRTLQGAGEIARVNGVEKLRDVGPRTLTQLDLGRGLATPGNPTSGRHVNIGAKAYYIASGRAFDAAQRAANEAAMAALCNVALPE